MSNTAPPLLCTYDGEAFFPVRPQLADRYFVVGETYPLVVHEARSMESHRHYFASLHEGWSNLPEDQAAQFPTAEHLRKFALVKAGYADERSIVCASKAEARRVAAFVSPMDEFAIVAVSEATVRVYTAKSQSMRAMGAKVFQKSKQDVLDIVSAMIGLTPQELAMHAGKAA